jgi:hypothetical protein
MFRPRAFSTPRRFAPETGLRAYCSPLPAGVRRHSAGARPAGKPTGSAPTSSRRVHPWNSNSSAIQTRALRKGGIGVPRRRGVPSTGRLLASCVQATGRVLPRQDITSLPSTSRLDSRRRLGSWPSEARFSPFTPLLQPVGCHHARLAHNLAVDLRVPRIPGLRRACSLASTPEGSGVRADPLLAWTPLGSSACSVSFCSRSSRRIPVCWRFCHALRFPWDLVDNLGGCFARHRWALLPAAPRLLPELPEDLCSRAVLPRASAPGVPRSATWWSARSATSKRGSPHQPSPAALQDESWFAVGSAIRISHTARQPPSRGLRTSRASFHSSLSPKGSGGGPGGAQTAVTACSRRPVAAAGRSGRAPALPKEHQLATLSISCPSQQPRLAACPAPGAVLTWPRLPEGRVTGSELQRSCPEARGPLAGSVEALPDILPKQRSSPALWCTHQHTVDRVTLKSRGISTSPTSRDRRAPKHAPDLASASRHAACRNELAPAGGRTRFGLIGTTRGSNRRPSPQLNSFAADDPTETGPPHKPCSTDEFIDTAQCAASSSMGFWVLPGNR